MSLVGVSLASNSANPSPGRTTNVTRYAWAFSAARQSS
jgi:hypothetical protein